MKKLFLFGVALATSVSAFADPAPFSAQALQSLTREALSNAASAPYVNLAKSRARVDAEAERETRVPPAKVDCNKPLVQFGSQVTNMCSFTARVAYGWYADPSLVISVNGYVNQTSLRQERLADSDLQITEVVIGTPPRTGLE